MSKQQQFTCPEGVGTYDIYRMYHEELESLTKHYPSIRRAQFFMSFSEKYLTHLRCLENVGMTSIEPIDFNGQQIVPIQFLRAVLPDPASLGPRTKGRTCIGCYVTGVKDGKPARAYVYNIKDHQDCYAEVKSQAISYTTGVPAMIGAKMMVEGTWMKPGVWNMEQLDPDPFMADLNQYGLPWNVIESPDFDVE